MKNYYELLEVSNTASIEIIRAAYKAGVKRYHPDNYAAPDDKARATEHLKLLNEALEVLADEVLRAKYDEELAAEMNFFGRGKANQNAWGTGYDKGQRDSEFGNSQTEHANGRDTQNMHNSRSENATDLTTYVESLIVHCKGEAEYLELHDLILKGSASHSEKQQMLGILDEFTKVRLQQELIEESKLEEYREEVKSLKRGLIVWIIIGIGLSSKFWWAFWVDIALCIIAYHGAKEDRENLSRAEYAAKHIAIYRMRGFKI